MSRPAVQPLVLSIQSQVAFGHVGNSAAATPMRLAGVEVVEVPTTLLSNHPHYPTMRGQVLGADLVADLLRGLEERGLPQRATAVLTGFMGSAAIAGVVSDFLAHAKAANPGLLYACDPVTGDADLGFFAPPDLRAAFADRLVPLADAIFPNAFELEALTGRAIANAADVAVARAALGVAAVVTTSVPVPTAADRIATVTATAAGLDQITHPRLPVRPAGTGDLLAGLAKSLHVRRMDLPASVARAADTLALVLRHTSATDWAEMPLTAMLPRLAAALTP